MARTERYTSEEVINAIRKGHTALGAAHILGCAPVTVRDYARKYPTIARALQQERRDLVDLSEMSLRGAILRAEGWAVSMTLKTLGKDDGYTERNEITGANGRDLRLMLTWGEDADSDASPAETA